VLAKTSDDIVAGGLFVFVNEPVQHQSLQGDSKGE
jgi:hypothetical protein